MKTTKKDDEQRLRDAKRSYREAEKEGNRREEARWANVIGDILKNRGEYVNALKWLRIDYEVSIKHLPEKQLLPTCQTIGELYLRLQDYQNALIYQKKHLELAKDVNDLIEQQRASTQLGRTYHEMFLKSDDDHFSVRNAKKYFKLAMKLAENLKKNKFSFVKEYIDAHNNIGMLEMDLDNLEEAEKILTRGLDICDEEEVIEDDDGRSRLHHNLGNVYMEIRKWDKAQAHIIKDIKICRNIGHCQGEAKGYINFGELLYRIQNYEAAINCYQKAFDLAKSMEDEDALVKQIEQNIETVKQAIKVIGELKKEEQNLKKLARVTETARGTSSERKCLLQQIVSLDRLIEKSSMIFEWLKHRDYAKKKKRIAIELCDKEKLADSFLVIGESYQKLRKFKKALKWYTKSLETYKLIGNLEGQALAKIDIGDILDSDGDWRGAFHAFKEGYRIALEAKLPSVQLSALENMHYSQMIRFDNVDEARKLQSLIDKLKNSAEQEFGLQDRAETCCSESETEIDVLSPNRSDVSISSERNMYSSQSTSQACADDLDENSPLISFLHRGKKLAKQQTAHEAAVGASFKLPDSSPRSNSISAGSHGVGRKRVRLVLSDDECENNEEYASRSLVGEGRLEEVATSNELNNRNNCSSPAPKFREFSSVMSKCTVSACTPVNHKESTCSDRSRTSKLASQDANYFRDSRTANNRKIDAGVSRNLFHKYIMSSLSFPACCNETCKHILVKIDEDFIHIDPDLCMVGDKLCMERMKVEVACLYYLQLPFERRAKGLVPIIQQMKYDGRALETLVAAETLKHHKFGKAWIEAFIGVWVPKRVMKLYIDCCLELSEQPNLKVLEKLYNLEVSEDEVIVSDCEVQDISIAPLLNALQAHKTVAVIDLSHNLLGNETVERLQQVFTSSGQNYGGLVLDLHCNRLGPASLFQICECPVLYSRLEVLNISGNRLTDACASYLSTILKNCKALYALNIEQCSVASRTIQKITDSLDAGSVLAHLSLGYNNPISGNALIGLLLKIAALTRFQELSLNGIKLSKPVVDSLCQLAKTSSMSALALGSTGIGIDGALQLTESLSNETQELVKLDLSSCGLTSDYIVKLNIEASIIWGILELNLGENPLMQKGGRAFASLLNNPQCCLKVLVLCSCQLGLVGMLQILEALPENFNLEELNLAGNVLLDHNQASPFDLISVKEVSNPMQTNFNLPDLFSMTSAPKEFETPQQEVSAVKEENNLLEVADSDDEQGMAEEAATGLNGSIIRKLSQNSQGYPETQFLQELLAAITMAKRLQLLDLSNNGFSQHVAEKLCTAWSSSSRAGSAQSHIQDNKVHLSVRGKKCCGMKPCCRRI